MKSDEEKAKALNAWLNSGRRFDASFSDTDSFEEAKLREVEHVATLPQGYQDLVASKEGCVVKHGVAWYLGMALLALPLIALALLALFLASMLLLFTSTH